MPGPQKFLAFEYQGGSLRTPWNRVVYAYRLDGYDGEWRWTRQPRVEYTNLPRGEYVFRVKAVDQDLLYSDEPAEVRVTIHLPSGKIALLGLLVISFVGLTVTSGYAVKRRWELVTAMKRELQQARDVQMGLLPKRDPHIEGFDIAGRCIPANRVGGDHYTYIWLNEEKTKLAVVLADITGKEMKAAMTVMQFSAILRYEAEGRYSPGEILGGLNRSVFEQLGERMYVASCVGVLDVSERCLEVSNAGHPPVYHLSGSEGSVQELRAPGFLLGMREDTEYEGAQVKVEEGDMLVFYTDGIVDAQDTEGRPDGFERLEEVIRDTDREIEATEMIDRIVQNVEQFTGTSQHGDDMTLVVIKRRIPPDVLPASG